MYNQGNNINFNKLSFDHRGSIDQFIDMYSSHLPYKLPFHIACILVLKHEFLGSQKSQSFYLYSPSSENKEPPSNQ